MNSGCPPEIAHVLAWRRDGESDCLSDGTAETLKKA